MKLIGKQIVVELPEKNKVHGYDHCCGESGATFCFGCSQEGENDALAEAARMNPAMEVSQEKIENIIESWLSCGESRLTPDDVKEIAQSLAADPSAWLKRKKGEPNETNKDNR